MKIEQIRISTVVHSLAGILLLGAVALFGYEWRKPAIVLAAPAFLTPKVSPMSRQEVAPEQLYRLPELPARYQHKVLVYGVRRKALSPEAGKNFAKAPTPGKVYLVAGARMPAEDE